MHLLAHAVWAQVALVAGAVRAGARTREAAEPLVVSRPRLRAVRLRGRVSRARAERMAVHALGVPAPRDRLDARRRRALPAGSGAASTAGRLACGFRAHLGAPRRAALRRSRCRADLRALRAGWTVRRRCSSYSSPQCQRSSLPSVAAAHVILESSEPATAVAARDGADRDQAPLQPAGDDHARTRSRCSRPTGRCSRVRPRPRTTDMSSSLRCPDSSGARRTPFAGA